VLNNHRIGFHIKVPSKKKTVPFPSLTLHQPPRAAAASVSASEPALLVRPVATVAFAVTSRGREAKLSLGNPIATQHSIRCTAQFLLHYSLSHLQDARNNPPEQV
jgi:hypothetical protein